MRIRTILVLGGYGNGNAGDEAQCAETLRLLAERYPRYQVRNLTPDPDYSFTVHPGFAHDYASRVMIFNQRRRFDWYRLGGVTRTAVFLLVSMLVYANAWFVKHGLPVWFINARKAAFLQELSQCSLLYFCGGGYLTGATRSRLWEGILLCRLAKIFNVPVAMSGQTMGLWGGRVEKVFARWGFRHVDVIGLRDDESSARDLADIGIAGDRVMPTHDDALFCEKAPNRQVEGRYIAVNFHYWGLEGGEREEALGKVHEAIEKARKATGVEKAVFIAMHKSDLKSFDGYQGRYHDANLTVMPKVGEFREIRRAIADCELLLTMKHHPIIFAVGEGVPVVSLAYSQYYVHKNFGAMQQYGVEACSTDLATAEWSAQFDAALAKALDRSWVSETTREHRVILKERKEPFLVRIDELVGGGTEK